jgi:signal transduction histidine kinase
MKAVTFLYFLLLVYIVLALLFWGVSLNKQSNFIFENEIVSLSEHIDSTANPDAYKNAFNAIKERQNIRNAQYLGEGSVFLIVIFIGASVVYSSIRRNHLLSKQESNFILSITHELKSPIAAVKLNLQTLAKRKLEEHIQQQLIHRSITEADRLDDLCNNLLLASQMESKQFKSSVEKINLTEIASQSVSNYMERGTHQWKVQVSPNTLVNGDALLWKLAINNLLENACKYTPANSTIEISLQPHDQDIVFAVADEGVGIPDHEKSKIFKKFYRVGNENSRKTKGTGLGLYLTSKITQQFKGSLIVRDNHPRGTVFEIVVPNV